MVLFLSLLLIPVIEIALFITIGGWLTLWPTLALVVMSATLGTLLIRYQGFAIIKELRSQIENMRDPTSPLAHGVMVIIAGLLLITPGFLTDAIGLSLLSPIIRRAIFRVLRTKIALYSAKTHQRPPHQTWQHGAQQEADHSTTIIDGEYHDATDNNKNPHNPTL